MYVKKWAMMADEKAGGEPSMEEILASIRQIINQNEKPAEGPENVDAAALQATTPEPVVAPAPVAVSASNAAAIDDAPEDEDVLVLTDILNEAPVTVAAEPAAAPVIEPEIVAPVVAPVMMAEPAVEQTMPTPSTELISNTSAAAATAALSTLASTLQQERNEHSLPLGNGMRTLESMAVEALKPLLKDWLDANLPAIVERIVQQEVEKLTKRLGA